MASCSLLLLKNYNTYKANICKNVPVIGFFKFCLKNSEIPNNFGKGSGKPEKIGKNLKIFYSRTISATDETRNSLTERQMVAYK
jgi:hypothetical protein